MHTLLLAGRGCSFGSQGFIYQTKNRQAIAMEKVLKNQIIFFLAGQNSQDFIINHFYIRQEEIS
jgi:hypothetical protein